LTIINLFKRLSMELVMNHTCRCSLMRLAVLVGVLAVQPLFGGEAVVKPGAGFQPEQSHLRPVKAPDFKSVTTQGMRLTDNPRCSFLNEFRNRQGGSEQDSSRVTRSGYIRWGVPIAVTIGTGAVIYTLYRVRGH
jgi:hypothetical protein